MRVVEIWRYPVKSLQGERLDRVEVDPGGLRGDRTYAIFDAETGFGLTARRVPELLYGAALLQADGALTIRLPDGSITRDDDALSDWLGRRVQLRQAADTAPRRYEGPADFEDETGRWEPFDGSPGAFHDSAEASVSLLARSTIGAWDARRFRANLLLDDGVETVLTGREASAGTAVLDVGRPLARCVMTTRPQPGGIERDLDVLRTIHREHRGRLAVRAVVRLPGTVAVGDAIG